MQRPGEKIGKNPQAHLSPFGSPEVGGARCIPVVFVFDLGRSGAVAQRNLSGDGGILQTDGYAGCNHVGVEGLVRVGCWAHACRNFVDAVKANKKDAYALDLVRRMGALFAEDREVRGGAQCRWRRRRSGGGSGRSRLWQKSMAGIKARFESRPGEARYRRAKRESAYGTGLIRGCS